MAFEVPVRILPDEVPEPIHIDGLRMHSRRFPRDPETIIIPGILSEKDTMPGRIGHISRSEKIFYPHRLSSIPIVSRGKKEGLTAGKVMGLES
jgi:hypothetical protein